MQPHEFVWCGDGVEIRLLSIEEVGIWKFAIFIFKPYVLEFKS